MKRCLAIAGIIAACGTAMAVEIEKVNDSEFVISDGGDQVKYTVSSAEERIEELKRERQQIISKRNNAVARVSNKFNGPIIAYTGEIDILEEAKQKAIDEFNMVNGY
jgi:hypothetical protein